MILDNKKEIVKKIEEADGVLNTEEILLTKFGMLPDLFL